jgi:hypothetical protein
MSGLTSDLSRRERDFAIMKLQDGNMKYLTDNELRLLEENTTLQVM